MAKEPNAHAPLKSNETQSSELAKAICGIIMPISGDDRYSDEHWRRVQRIILRAIDKAGMQSRLVWENPEVDVIHSRILHNIYECDVVVCDVSGLNPNVMLELGLRLSTKRPTIVITDGEIRPPFDLAVFQYHQYQRDLEYNSLDTFIEQMATKIINVDEAYRKDKYKSFVENFTFQVVQPTEVSVPAEEVLRDRLDALTQQIKRLDLRIAAEASPRRYNAAPVKLTFDTSIISSQVPEALSELKSRKGVISVDVAPMKQKFGHIFYVTLSANLTATEVLETRDWVKETLSRIDDDVPF